MTPGGEIVKRKFDQPEKTLSVNAEGVEGSAS
jgi:hypothetical protein